MAVVTVAAGNDLLINSTNGLILKDAQTPAHYWRLTITTIVLGVPTMLWTDLGTTQPT